MTSGSEILPAQAAQLLDDLTVIVAHACAEIAAVSSSTVVRRMFIGEKLHVPSGRLLEAFGFRPVEVHYSLWLGD